VKNHDNKRKRTVRQWALMLEVILKAILFIRTTQGRHRGNKTFDAEIHRS